MTVNLKRQYPLLETERRKNTCQLRIFLQYTFLVSTLNKRF